MRESFFSKLLLFGEYSIIRNSRALAIPYPIYKGHLSFNLEKNSIDNELMAFYQYVENKKNLSMDFDKDGFFSDINCGLYFNSSIPKGFGIGSSGALCAALFSRYGSTKSNDIKSLKKFFSEIESHFHGASSGLDPLISYLNKPILISNDEIETLTLPEFTPGEGGLFLLNTKRERRTEPLVNLFLEKCKSEEYSGLCDGVLNPITNACIQSFLKADTRSLYEFFREISDFQFRHFKPMIPPNFQLLWRDGLKTEDFYLKLCGAGGGGFLMGITKNLKKTQEKLNSFEIQTVFNF